MTVNRKVDPPQDAPAGDPAGAGGAAFAERVAELTVRGVGGAPGVAVGRAVAFAERRAERTRARPGDAAAELERLAAGADEAAGDLSALAAAVAADGHPGEAAIFGAQAAMARDPSLLEAAAERIRQGVDAASAVDAAARELAEQLAAIGDELLAARSADVLDVGDRIAARIDGVAPAVPRLDGPAVVVGHDLPPSVAAELPRDLLRGIVLEAGSVTAHAVILARAYGIPAVVGAAGIVAQLGARPTATIALDGTTGEVVVDPRPATQAHYGTAASAQADRAARARAEASWPAVTLDGTEIDLRANLGTPAEAADAITLGARGVGLFRTEFLFMERPVEPSEGEQLDAYAAVIRAFAPHPVTIRLLDAGADKPIAWLGLPREPNPFLGVRGLRLAGRHEAVFVRQLRAAMRAAALAGAGPVKVMAPMVADAGDVTTLVTLARRAAAELAAERLPHAGVALGAMLEIPAAILTADAWFRATEFASLGTNDLLQYTIAVDRGSPELARYQDPLHPALLRLVRLAVEAAERAGIELSVCGEMAGDPAAALALAGLGIRGLSMAPPSLAAVRRAVRAASLEDLEATAFVALGDPGPAEVRARFVALLPEA